MNIDPDFIDPPHTLPPAMRLWRAVVNQLLVDAECWRKGVKPAGGDPVDAETAYLELLHCGPHLRRACGYADLDPVAVSGAYRRWIGEAVATR